MSTDWKDFELLVKLIEESISPDSTIEHDVRLPDLNSPSGATTQCDLVITSGKAGRETKTIVEIQNRKSRVKANDFRGWEKKREIVGAHHLICVSRHPFPKPARETASRSGGTIRLVQLSTADAGNIPFDVCKFRPTYEDFSLVESLVLTTFLSDAAIQGITKDDPLLARHDLSPNEPVFSFDAKSWFSLYTLCRDSVPSKAKEAGEGIGELCHYGNHGPKLFYRFRDKHTKLGLHHKFRWKSSKTALGIGVLSYEQDEHGVLAWVANISGETPRGPIELKVPITRNGSKFSLHLTSEGIPAGHIITVGEDP